MRSHRPHLARLLAAAAALAVTCPAPTPLPAQPAPAALPACAPPVAVTVIAPFTGQPGDIAIFAASAAPLAVAREVVRTQAGLTRRDTVCLGLVAPAGKRWTASAVDSAGALAVLGSYSSRSYAASVVWARSLATPPAWPTVPPTVPKDTVTPTSASLPSLDSLAAWIGSAPIVPSAQVRAMGPAFAAYDSLVRVHAQLHWQREGTNWGDNYYDRARLYYALCGRSGDPTWCARGDSMAVHYRDDYVLPSFAQGGPSPHWSAFQGVFAHWKRTGADADRLAIAKTAESVWGGYANLLGAPTLNLTAAGMTKVDPRIHGRVLLQQLLAWRAGGHPSVGVQAWGTAGTYEARIHAILAGLAAWQIPSGPRTGAWPTEFACGGQNNFEAGILHDALIEVYTSAPFLTAAERASIVTMVARGAGYLWVQNTAKGPPYGDLALVAAAGAPGTCATDNGTQPAPDLTGLLIAPFPWLARVTGDAGWRTRGEALWPQMVRDAAWDGTKQFNQLGVSSWQYPGWR